MRAVVAVLAMAAVALLATPATASIIDLTNEDFFHSVTRPKERKTALVMWHHASCNACRALEYSLKQTAKHFMKGDKAGREKVMICRMDAGQFQKVARQHNIEKFPTLQLWSYGRDGPVPITFDPAPEDLIEYIEKEVKRLVKLDAEAEKGDEKEL